MESCNVLVPQASIAQRILYHHLIVVLGIIVRLLPLLKNVQLENSVRLVLSKDFHVEAKGIVLLALNTAIVLVLSS